MTSQPPAIVLSASYGGLAAVRCLALAGIPSVVIGNRRLDTALFSRYPRKFLLPRGAVGDEALVEQILTLRESGGVLIPPRDENVYTLVNHRALLSKYFHLACPSDRVAKLLLDKRSEWEAVNGLGVPTPVTVTQLPATSTALADQLPFPILLKPDRTGRAFGKKGFLIGTREELERFYAEKAGRLGDLIAQEFIPGDETALWTCTCVFNQAHQLVSAFTFHKIRTSPSRIGIATFARHVFNPKIVELARKLGEGLGYVGIADIEFKWDSRRAEYKYIETNPRLIHTSEFAAKCGVNQVEQAYRLALGETLLPSRGYLRDGQVYVRPLNDLLARLNDRQRLPRIAIDTLRLFRYAPRGTPFSWSDPLPGFTGYLKLLQRAASFFRHRFFPRVTE